MGTYRGVFRPIWRSLVWVITTAAPNRNFNFKNHIYCLKFILFGGKLILKYCTGRNLELTLSWRNSCKISENIAEFDRSYFIMFWKNKQVCGPALCYCKSQLRYYQLNSSGRCSHYATETKNVNRI